MAKMLHKAPLDGLAARRRRRVRLRRGSRLAEVAAGRRPRLPRPAGLAVVPTLLTLGNALCGFGSITYAVNVETVTRSPAYSTYMFRAGLLIFVAMLFDLLDGHVARLTKQTTDFGKQLDSLCDVVSFGVAPAWIVTKFSYHYHPRVLWVVALLYLFAVVLRLARYNSETAPVVRRGSFSGLPCPAAAGMIASVAVTVPAVVELAEYGATRVRQVVGNGLIATTSLLLPVIALAMAWLMVSRIEYQRVDRLFRARRSFHEMVPLVAAVVVVGAAHELAIPLILMYFVLVPPLVAARKRWWPRPGDAPAAPQLVADGEAI